MKIKKLLNIFLPPPPPPPQASVLASQEKLRHAAAFGDKKEYIALMESQLSNARSVTIIQLN